MTTATVTPTTIVHPLVAALKRRYLRWRLDHLERDIAGCQNGVAALEAEENAYRDHARGMRDELRALEGQ